MFRPSLKSTWSLIALLILSIILFVFAHRSYVTIKADYYDQKVEAAQLMVSCMDTLRAEQQRLGIPFDPIDDPNQTGLIGAARTTITTDRGLLSEKQIALNPNLAAVFVEEFSRQGLKPGDHIAVSITGSNPAVNLALYAAISVLKLEPTIVVSLSSASYGANLEEYTWLDIESILRQKGLLDFGCSHASLGGKDDLGEGLSESGINALRDAMSRNQVIPIIGDSFEENIQARLHAYNSQLPAGKRYGLFVNVGRGLASVGSIPNANQIREGMNPKLAEELFEPEGVMMIMAREGVPVFSMQHPRRWIRRYKLEDGSGRIPEPGVGPAFSVKKHNVTVAAICFVILVAAIVAVIVFDRKGRNFMANIVDPDEEL
ncbi:MAG: poly-gamma-glutamate system protein [Candidatus Cloacimonetes bacterium]|nr:poly-gamma-glutamate system protein [Candidatus Cloacimonadota bacterium]